MGNDINELDTKIGRTPEVDESRIIEAGKRLEKSGKRVTKWGLRNAVGAGNPSRLMRVWEAFKAENGEVVVVAANAEEVPALPPEVEDGLRIMLGEVNSGIEQLIRNSNTIAVRVADMRVKSQYDATKAAQVDAENELSEAEAALDQADQRITDLTMENKQQATVIRELTGQYEKLKAEHEQLQKQHTDVNNKLDKLEAKTTSLSETISTQKSELDVARSEILLQKAEIDRLHTVDGQLNETRQDLAKTGTELKFQQQINETTEQQCAKLLLKETELTEALQTYKAQKDLLMTQFAEQKERAVKAEQENTDLHSVIAKQAEEIGTVKANIETLSKQLTTSK